MGKITVKHYLNTKIKPISYFDDGKDYFPIYTQITYNRKTTQLRSFTDAITTKAGFDEIENGNADFKEIGFIHPYNDGLNIIEALKKEERDIGLSIYYILSHNIQIDGKHELREILQLFFVYISEILIENAFYDWIADKFHDHKTYKATRLYDAFNERFTLYDSIDLIKKYTKIDLSEYIAPKDWELSKYIYFYLKRTSNLTYIDLLRSDYKTEVNNIKEIKNKEMMIEFIEYAINSHLLYYQINT